MTAIDWIIVGGYFAIVFGLAWWVILRGKDTADDYFLAGRNLGWFVVGASIFASNIGSEHLVGLAGSGCTDGVAMAHYELHAWCLLILGWVFVPFYMRSKVFTMPEFLERRFSPGARWLLSLISLVAYVLTKIAVGIFAGGIVFRVLLPELQMTLPNGMVLDSFWIGSILVVVLTGLYTVLGGLRAVAYTEALQTGVLVFGSILVTIFGLHALGGWTELRTICGSEMFNLWKPLVPDDVTGTWAPVLEKNTKGEVTTMAWYFNQNYPWLGMLICAPISGLWYWCTDQYIVQRCLGAPNEREARRGAIWSAWLKLLPVFIFIIPGMICLALAVSGRSDRLTERFFGEVELQRVLDGEADGLNVKPVRTGRFVVPDAEIRTISERQVVTNGRVAVVGGEIEEVENGLAVTGGTVYVSGPATQGAFPQMVRDVLPPGVRGIVVAGLLAALMSSLAGVFNASSTLFTMDFYRGFRPNATQHELVWMGRIATTMMVVIGLIWIPVIQGARGLYDYLQSVQGYLAPPIFTVFFLGVFWKRLNAKGCLWALGVGFVLGLFRLAVDTPTSLLGYQYPHGSFFWIVNNIFFQYYATFIFIVSVIVMVVVSYFTSEPDAKKIEGLTYGTITADHRRESRASWNWKDVVASGVVLAAIIAAYLYFRG